jgi:Cu2+-exporting ATPase
VSDVVQLKPSPAATPAAANDSATIDCTDFVHDGDDGAHTLYLLVEGAHCGGCVRRIEGALNAFDDVTAARMNLSTRRVTVSWQGPAVRANVLARAVAGLGFRVQPYDPVTASGESEREGKTLLRAMAVAGFAAANVMLLSVSIWSGHVDGMTAATRDLFHWISALIALPAVVYAGRPFFRSAWRALSRGHANMDVPISLAVILASAMSLAETIRGAEHAYFDSAVMLLFFLLVGRYLDHRARGKVRSAAERLLALGQAPVTVIAADGSHQARHPANVAPGERVLVATGERLAVDGVIERGAGELDTSLITGETLPQHAVAGDPVHAGTLNVGAPLTLTVTAVGEGTVLADIVRLMEAAEQRRAGYVAVADRVARIYAPVVHGLAAGTFLGWVALGGMAWQGALMNAVAVLIITCPCALGLAVPAVQVIASGSLMGRGILLKSATALERFASVDTVVFDKTGTLTEGRPELVNRDGIAAADLELAAAMAASSRHPLARAVQRAVPGVAAAEDVREVAGSGLARDTANGEVRLGSRSWCGLGEDAQAASDEGDMELWLKKPEGAPVRFLFRDRLRADAGRVVAELKKRGYAVELLSGDRQAAVEKIAEAAGISNWRARCRPEDKCARLAELAGEGRRVLMVGDGLNDAPALAAAHVSLSPSSAADISQTAADAVFQGGSLDAVLQVIDVAKRAGRLVRQNFAAAAVYNVVTVPLAIMGFVTPLIAAAAMSSSSLVVVGNALRLSARRRRA